MEKGTIVISPFEERNLKTSSYDVTLGDWYWREEKPATGEAIHNLYDEGSTSKVWSGPHQAESVTEFSNRTGKTLKNVSEKAKIIMLAPGETILAHTREFIGGREVCVGKMYARSSMGRNFVEVCKDAGWGDVGYFNRWTMEVTNNSQYFSIPLVVGRRVAQIVFYEVAPLNKQDVDYVGEGGKYQVSQDLDEVISSWHPKMMVPRMHMDWEIEEGR